MKVTKEDKSLLVGVTLEDLLSADKIRITAKYSGRSVRVLGFIVRDKPGDKVHVQDLVQDSGSPNHGHPFVVSCTKVGSWYTFRQLTDVSIDR